MSGGYNNFRHLIVSAAYCYCSVGLRSVSVSPPLCLSVIHSRVLSAARPPPSAEAGPDHRAPAGDRRSAATDATAQDRRRPRPHHGRTRVPGEASHMSWTLTRAIVGFYRGTVESGRLYLKLRNQVDATRIRPHNDRSKTDLSFSPEQ